MLKNTIIVLLFVGWINPASAALVERDYLSVGDSLLTLDTLTNLEWLDVSETVGLSYSSVLSSSYVIDGGFQYASQAQLATLWASAGATGTHYYNPYEVISIVAENYTAAVQLVHLLGCTSSVIGVECDGTGQNWHIGLYGDTAPTETIIDAAVVDYFGQGDYREGRAAMWFDYGMVIEDFHSRIDVGSFLVREAMPVSIPSTIWLLGFVLFGMLRFPRHKNPA